MSTNKPDMAIAWGSIGGVTEPTDAKKELGYVKEKVSYQLMNWVNNRADNYIQHNNVEGISVWDTDTIYEIGSLAKDTTGRVIFRSLTSPNQSNIPATSPADWEIAFVNSSNLMDVAVSTISNTVTFTYEDLGLLNGLYLGMGAAETVDLKSVVFTQDQVLQAINDIVDAHIN